MNSNGSAASWSIPYAQADRTVKVTQVPDHVCVGQIPSQRVQRFHKPLLELFYTAMAMSTCESSNSRRRNEVHHVVGNVPVGQQWSYVISPHRR